MSKEGEQMNPETDLFEFTDDEKGLGLTRDQALKRREGHERGKSLKVGDLVRVSGVSSLANGSMGRVVGLKHPGEEVPGPSVEITDGPNTGKVTGSLYNGQWEPVER